MKWNIDEMKRQRDAIGVTGAAGFDSTTLGAAEIVLAQKTLLETAATKEYDTRSQWLVSA